MAAIDVGADCIGRAETSPLGYTYIDKNNPANLTGTITQVDIWAAVNLANCEVGIFEEVAANTFTTRSNAAIGAVTAGSKQSFVVNLAIVAGDYIGIYFTAGDIERDGVGAGLWYFFADCIPCTAQAFTAWATQAISVYGIGATPAVGWTGKISGVTNPAKIMGVDVANIAKVKGVA